MKFISEIEIDKVIERLNDEGEFDKASKNLIENQPALIGYLDGEGFKILTSEEQDLLWYCLLVVVESSSPGYAVSVQDLLDKEEENYDLVGDQMTFDIIADQLFEEYGQEDLLAFVEDTLIPDEETFITPVGRKVLFLSLKSVIDVLDMQEST